MAARAAIKPVDPQARVVVGGLALGNNGGADEIQFLQRMFAHRPDLKGNVDAVGLHPYQLAVADVYRRIALFRAALDRLAGPSVPIELTELGWSTTAVSDAQRAANLAALASQLPAQRLQHQPPDRLQLDERRAEQLEGRRLVRHLQPQRHPEELRQRVRRHREDDARDCPPPRLPAAW